MDFLSSCGTQAWLPHGRILVPPSGIKPTSSTLGSGLLTTEPPGKSLATHLLQSSSDLFAPLILFSQLSFLTFPNLHH